MAPARLLVPVMRSPSHLQQHLLGCRPHVDNGVLMREPTFCRLIREANGDLKTALQLAAHTIDYLAGHVSVGAMRAGPKTDRAAKRYVEGLDVSDQDAPHG